MAAIYSNSKALILLLVITLTLTIPARSSFLHDPSDYFHDVVLGLFRIPRGLFPLSNYSIDGNGTLEIIILNDGPCIFRASTSDFDPTAAIDIMYRERVQGTISYGQIIGLSGMNMKTDVSTVNWRKVTEIRVPYPGYALTFTFSDGGSFGTDTGYFQFIPICTPLEVGVLGEENLHDIVDEVARPWSGVSRKALI